MLNPLTLDELLAVDPAGLHFSPFGLGPAMKPEDALEFQQDVIGQCDLVAAVAEGTRQSFEMLRKIFPYGLLCYDLYTVVEERALLVIEQAHRDRFVAHYGGTVTVKVRGGGETSIAAGNYDDFYDAYKEAKGTHIRVSATGRWLPFKSMLFSLREWAREEGLVRSQRSRLLEQILADLRNRVAHPSEYALESPVDAARTISDLAEIINQLWGSPTPGGRIHPAPVEQRVVAIGWNPEGTQIMVLGDVDNLGDQSEGSWEFVVVRAVFSPGVVEDHGLTEFDSRFETTMYPSELLWGPGGASEAAAWCMRKSSPRREHATISTGCSC